ncbi:MAG: zraR 1 [Bacteriovoracaceae bacterium]|nr:zraR 1 [Bacteriovoracaceae bacterium]
MNSKHHILICDDSEDVRSLYKLALEQEHFVVETAQSRSEAQSLVEDWEPDLILVDFRMTGISFNAFVKFLKTNPKTQASKVIALSSFSKTDPTVLNRDPSVQFFQKPASLSELLSIVQNSL